MQQNAPAMQSNMRINSMNSKVKKLMSTIHFLGLLLLMFKKISTVGAALITAVPGAIKRKVGLFVPNPVIVGVRVRVSLCLHIISWYYRDEANGLDWEWESEIAWIWK